VAKLKAIKIPYIQTENDTAQQHLLSFNLRFYRQQEMHATRVNWRTSDQNMIKDDKVPESVGNPCY
jgi:hypothetical protein